MNECNPLFDPNHPFSTLFKQCRYKVFYGGRGTGKSWALAEALIRIAEAACVRVLCTRQLQTSIKHSVHKLLSDTISRLEMDSKFEITQNSIKSHTGSEFIFMGVQFNYQELKSLESIDITWVEEGQCMSEEAWIVVMPTILRKPNSECWVSFNTGAETDSTYKRWIINPPVGSIVHKVTHEQNPFFTNELREGMERDRILLDPEVFDNVWNGEPLKLSEAVIFKGKFEVRLFEPPRNVDWLHGIDFGFSVDPTALTRNFINHDENILYIDSEICGYGAENDDLPTLVKSMDTIKERWKVYGDCSRPETISHLKKHGVNIEPCKKWSGSVNDGIYFLKSFNKIIIHPRCVKTLAEFNSYSWKVDRVSGDVQPIPMDKNNHFIDSIRYSLNKHITNKGTSIAQWENLARTS